jgi:hypothetical protein
MAVYEFPAFGDLFSPSRGGFNIVHNTTMEVSKVNRSQSIGINPGESWVVSWYFSVIENAKAHDVRAVLNKLRGHQHKIKLIDNKYSHKIGWLGNPTVDGAGQYGLLLDISTSVNNTLIAKATDRFHLNGQLFEIVDDAVTDSSGNCTLVLANEIRNIPVDNAPLITALPNMYCLCRWADPNQIKQFEGDRRLYRGISFDFIEALP